jgi:hypothetical protein
MPGRISATAEEDSDSKVRQRPKSPTRLHEEGVFWGKEKPPFSGGSII